MFIAQEIEMIIEKYLSKREHSGLVLMGEKGIGKRQMADMIARRLLQEEKLSCCPDYMVIESVNGSILLEQLEKLKIKTLYCAVSASYKVFVIDDADCMNMHSQNSLLKILEDGNATNIFIFVAHKPLLDTIHSRCETIRVTKPCDTEVEKYFKESGVKMDNIMMKIADYRIGLYHNMISDANYTEDSKDILNQILTIKKKRDILNAFGMVKEKDGSSFYDCYSADKVLMFVKFLKEMFCEVLYDFMGISSNTDYTIVKQQFNSLQCINIIDFLENHIQRMSRKGQYTRNDFFDLIRYIISGVAECK